MITQFESLPTHLFAKTDLFFMRHHLAKKGRANKLYLLPKVHKTPVGARPINASCGYFLAGIDKYVAHTLSS